MSLSSNNLNGSPDLSKKNNIETIPVPPEPPSSSQINGDKDNREENTDTIKPEKNGILKKKVAIGTITLSTKDKIADKWQDSYVPSEADTSETDNNKGKKENRKGGDVNMAKRVTEIFQEVFNEQRGHWSLKIEFYMSCIGVPVAFSSFWRFPLLMNAYGGGAFLFAYILLMLLIGLPLYCMEIAIGQFSQLGVLHVWKCAPLMQGVGISMILLSLITSVYNSQFAAYATHYFFASFVNMDKTMLWGECREYWPKCYDVRSNNICSFLNITEDITVDPKRCVDYMIASSQYYWEDKVLRLTDIGSVGKTGAVHWDLTLCLAFVWLCSLLFLVKGIKSSGKIALFTGFVPICILLAFLTFSVQKPGALMGLQELYFPEWEELIKPKVWQSAAEQVLFSLCVTYGSIITFSSYKKFKTEIQIGAVFLTLANIIVTVMCSTTVFAICGALGHSIGVRDIKSLMMTEDSDIEIVFVFVPEALARLFPFPHVWSIFFFFMVLCFALHAQFSLTETCLTAVYDALPKLRRKKIMSVISLVLPLFLLSIPLSSSTGLHIHNLIGTSIVGPNVLLIAIFEIIGLHFFYGVRRFSRDLKFILKSEVSIFWKVMWVFIAPVSIIVLLIFAALDHETLIYEGRKVEEEWTLYLSWILTLLPIAMIPLTFIFTIFYKLCIKEPVFQPSCSWGPGCPKLRETILENIKLIRDSEDNQKLDGNDNEAFVQNQG